MMETKSASNADYSKTKIYSMARRTKKLFKLKSKKSTRKVIDRIKNNNEVITAYWNKNVFVLNLTSSKMVSPVLQMLNTNGQVVLTEKLSSESVNSIAANLPSGIYIFNIADGKNTATGKTSKQ